MRIVKDAETRKTEILDVAEQIFWEKGYEHATINDILAETGLAKGSLYYHFKSKEDILDGLIKRRGDVAIETAGSIAHTDGLDAQTKLLLIILSQQPSDERQKQLTADLEKTSGGQMFIKSLNDIVLRLAPVMQGIIEQGISEGVFSTPYPLESSEILLAAAHALFDNGDFAWTQEQRTQKLTAFFVVVERTLGITEGSLFSLAQSYVANGANR